MSPSLGEAICRMAISTSFWRAGVRKRAWALAGPLGRALQLLEAGWGWGCVMSHPHLARDLAGGRQALCKEEMSPREELKEEVRKGSWGWRLRTESH